MQGKGGQGKGRQAGGLTLAVLETIVDSAMAEVCAIVEVREVEDGGDAEQEKPVVLGQVSKV